MKCTRIVQLLAVMLSLFLATSSAFDLATILFGNSYIYRNQHLPYQPGSAQAHRGPYQYKYGPAGNHLRDNELTFGHHYRRHRRTFAPLKFRLPVFAPFGTDGFDLDPELAEQRKREDEDRERQERQEKGFEADF